MSNDITFYQAYKIFDSDRNKYATLRFHTQEGFINFYMDETVHENEALIYAVSVKESHRRQGLFTKFINQLYNDNNIRKIGILAVESAIMINCLKKITFDGYVFFDHGGDFLYAKDHNYCKCHKILRIDNDIKFVDNR